MGALIITCWKVWRSHEITQLVLEILFVVTLAPFTHPDMLAQLSESQQIPVANEQKSGATIDLY